jgi:uncharacterized protein DUF3617
MKSLGVKSVTLACAIAFAIPSLSLAQKKVPGEKWKQTVSIEAAGMKMPARTLEVCVPVGKAEEALARPPDNNDCKMTDVQRSGNKFSGNLHCTGKTPVEGRIEMTTEGNRTVGKMQMQMQGMTMNMNTESTKLGTACEATDYSNFDGAAATKKALEAQGVDLCAQLGERLGKDKREMAGTVAMYAGKDAQCAKHASFKTFCSAVQTPAGFASLAQSERLTTAMKDRNNAVGMPLTTALQACGLPSDKPGIDAMRSKLLASAEKSGDWDFLVQEGNDATFAMLTTTAKRECAGRSYTNQPAGRYATLCNKYGVDLARGDRTAAQRASGAYAAPAASAPTTATPTGSATPETPAQDEEAASKGKARDALDKGKQKLRNIFGGGG